MKIVVKVGGSILFTADGPNTSYIKKMLPILKKVKKENQLIFCIGAGKFLKTYVNNVKDFFDNDDLEWLFVDLLRTNVNLYSNLLDMKPILKLNQLNSKTSGVISGIKPGRSTDANAAYAAKIIGADIFVKMTDVDGVYDKDPKKFSNAKLLKIISFNEIKKYSVKGTPGNYGILDEIAMDYIIKNKIKTVVLNGNDPKNLLKILKGEKIGTEIS